MTATADPAARRREREAARRRRRLRTAFGWLFRVAAVAFAFLAGVAVGHVVTEEPEPGGTHTVVRTLEPQSVSPPARTVTVTSSAP